MRERVRSATLIVFGRVDFPLSMLASTHIYYRYGHPSLVWGNLVLNSKKPHPSLVCRRHTVSRQRSADSARVEYGLDMILSILMEKSIDFSCSDPMIYLHILFSGPRTFALVVR